MYASDKSEKAYTYYSNGGVTVSLKEGEIYTINVIQHSKTGNYTINIGVPNAVVETSENNISGNMLYIDQADTYLYKASITGVHVFSFETNDVESNYEVVVISSTNEKLMQTYYSNKTKKVELEAGQEYIIKVVQYIGFPMYTINISME